MGLFTPASLNQAAPSWREDTCVSFGEVVSGNPANGNLLLLCLFSRGLAVKRFPRGARSFSFSHSMSSTASAGQQTGITRADVGPKADQRALQQTALSHLSGALVQGHMSLSHTAKSRQLGKTTVFLFSSTSSPQIGEL